MLSIYYNRGLGWIKKSVIFDLDGTLADSSADLIHAANACLVAHGMDAGIDVIADKQIAFLGGRALLTLGAGRSGVVLEEAELMALYPKFLGDYRAGLCIHTHPYDGVVEALETLRSRGFALGICTNKPLDLAVDLVAEMELSDYFGAILGADSLPVRKPDPEHLFETVRQCGVSGKTLLVGDTITDSQTAINAGVPFILFTDSDVVPLDEDNKPIGYDVFMRDYSELADIVNGLLGDNK